MNSPNSSRNVQLHIDGDVSGQIAIGESILQIGEIHGGIVNIVAPQKKPNFSPQARPVYLRPLAFHGLLDRAKELGSTVGALEVPESISIHGQSGLGKTALLRYLAYNSPEDRFPDGIVYLSARDTNVDDLLQEIFECFYQSDIPAKPTHVRLCQLLQSVRALILLDDLTLAYDEVSELINSAPQCAFIFASMERCLWGEGRCIELEGLPVQEALLLIERGLGRPLDAQERPIAEAFCQKAKGHPLSVIQGAALVRQGKAFTDLESRFVESEKAATGAVLDQLTDAQRRVLSLLAALGNIPVSREHLKALSQLKDFDVQFKALLDLHLVQANSPAYNMTGSLALFLGRITNLAESENLVLDYFVQWIRQNPPLPDITDALNLILSLMEKANRDGRWDEVITLGRGIEKALILGKRWQSWLQVLEWILKAAHALGDRATQGWALHQLGTRSLCLGNLDPARQLLTQALNVREALGDQAGAAVTRHNLNLILAPPAPPRDTPHSPPRPGPRGGGSLLLKLFFGLLVVAALGVGGVLAWPLINPPPAPPTKRPANTARVVPPPTPPTRPPTEKPPPTEPPPPHVCARGVWYCEDFDDGEAQDFVLDPGWFIRSNALEGTRHSWATLMNDGWDDYRLTFRLNLSEGTIHLIYRYIPENGPVRYFVGFNEKFLYLTKQVRDEFTELKIVETSHSLGKWYTVEIAGWGGHLAVFVNDELKLQYEDEKFIRGGTFAFETLDDSRALIDEVEVMESGKEPPIISIVKPNPVEICEYIEVTREEDTDRMGMDYSNFSAPDSGNTGDLCRSICEDDPNCQAYTFDQFSSDCWLKEGIPDPTPKEGFVSGIKVCR